jgi:hypothetical protein
MTCTLGSFSASIFGGSASIELLLCKQRRLASLCEPKSFKLKSYTKT